MLRCLLNSVFGSGSFMNWLCNLLDLCLFCKFHTIFGKKQLSTQNKFWNQFKSDLLDIGFKILVWLLFRVVRLIRYGRMIALETLFTSSSRVLVWKSSIRRPTFPSSSERTFSLSGSFDGISLWRLWLENYRHLVSGQIGRTSWRKFQAFSKFFFSDWLLAERTAIVDL